MQVHDEQPTRRGGQQQLWREDLPLQLRPAEHARQQLRQPVECHAVHAPHSDAATSEPAAAQPSPAADEDDDGDGSVTTSKAKQSVTVSVTQHQPHHAGLGAPEPAESAIGAT